MYEIKVERGNLFILPYVDSMMWLVDCLDLILLVDNMRSVNNDSIKCG